jgi:hypothetical protein
VLHSVSQPVAENGDDVIFFEFKRLGGLSRRCRDAGGQEDEKK